MSAYVCLCLRCTWVCRREHRSQKRTSVSCSVTACLTPLRQSTSSQLKQHWHQQVPATCHLCCRVLGYRHMVADPDISVTWGLGSRLRSLCLQNMSPTKSSPVPPEPIHSFNNYFYVFEFKGPFFFFPPSKYFIN